MFRIAYVISAPPPDGTPDPASTRADGPYPLLSQAEYAARIWRSLERAAEVVAADGNGPWWVHVQDPVG